MNVFSCGHGLQVTFHSCILFLMWMMAAAAPIGDISTPTPSHAIMHCPAAFATTSPIFRFGSGVSCVMNHASLATVSNEKLNGVISFNEAFGVGKCTYLSNPLDVSPM